MTTHDDSSASSDGQHPADGTASHGKSATPPAVVHALPAPLPPMNPGYGNVLVVTNDFPPTVGGIQTYVRDYLATLDPTRVIVLASTQNAEAAAEWDSTCPYAVERMPTSVLLPTPGVAAKMRELIAHYNIDVVWFAAAAPLALLAPVARHAGVRRIVASTHGHEVGWSMIPGARAALRRIGVSVDCMTYVSRYARDRIAPAFGPTVPWEPLPGGVDTGYFASRNASIATLRERYGIDPANDSVIVSISRIVPRKGQDMLIEAMPHVLRERPDAVLVIVGPGPTKALRRSARRLGISERVIITGPVPAEELADHYRIGDVFALPVRTQAGGLSVEGLGLVYLEAQAVGVPPLAGDGGGAPEAVRDGVTGRVVNGRDAADIAAGLLSMLNDRPFLKAAGAAGQEWVGNAWNWRHLRFQLDAVLAGDGRVPPPVAWYAPDYSALRNAQAQPPALDPGPSASGSEDHGPEGPTPAN